MGLLSESYISYVNLDHRQDRLNSITSQLNKHGIEAVRTPGIYPHERSEDKSRMIAMLKRKQVGALGCYLAQVDVMKKALELNMHAFVMEDDIVLCEDFNKRIEYIDNWIKKGSGYDFLGMPVVGDRSWDVIWLGGTFHVGTPYWDQKRNEQDRIGKDVQTTNDPRMLRSYGSFSTFAYIVNRDSISKVLNLLDEFLPQSIGIDYSFIQLSHKMNNYVFVPGCAKQIDNASDQHEGAFTEFSRFSRLNGTEENSRYWYQERMEDFNPEIFDWKEARS